MHRTPRLPYDCIAPTRPTASVPRSYSRPRDLPRILPLWPAEIADLSLEGRRRVVQKLRRALREERRRGLAGHWAYDLTRHAALFRAFAQEARELAALELPPIRSGMGAPTARRQPPPARSPGEPRAAILPAPG